MEVVILVPWRGGEAIRERNWRITRPYLERFGWPIHLGDREGPWSRAAAVNAAAKEAGDWDVAVIADADTIPEPAAVKRAVRTVRHEGSIRPHTRLWHLNRPQTTLLAQQGPRAVRTGPRTPQMPGGGLLVISRRAWDQVNGFPEEFVGWGHEDSAMGIRLVALAGWNRIPGQAWHLWHPRPKRDTPERRRNHQRMEQLRRKHRAALARASEDLGFDVGAVL